jgi:hypothetical protein
VLIKKNEDALRWDKSKTQNQIHAVQLDAAQFITFYYLYFPDFERVNYFILLTVIPSLILAEQLRDLYSMPGKGKNFFSS